LSGAARAIRHNAPATPTSAILQPAAGNGRIAAKRNVTSAGGLKDSGYLHHGAENVMSGLEDKIRQRAYELWEQSGRTDGSEMDFWLQAEREIAGETSPEPPQDRLE
jgi:hypothetical protein